MSVSIDQVKICNIALKRLSARPINAVTDQTPTAQALRTVWDLAVLTTLRAHPWKFATKIKPLALLADEVMIGWDYLYRYPADAEMVWQVCDANSYINDTYANEYDALLSPDTDTYCIATNVSNAYAKYTTKVVDVSKWDSTFADALAWRIAMDISQEMTGDPASTTKYAQGFAQAIAMAQTMNKVESNNPTEEYQPFIDVRGYGCNDSRRRGKY